MIAFIKKRDTIGDSEDRKMSSKFTGPYVILECGKNDVYKLANFYNGRILKNYVHADKLKSTQSARSHRHRPQTVTTIKAQRKHKCPVRGTGQLAAKSWPLRAKAAIIQGSLAKGTKTATPQSTCDIAPVNSEPAQTIAATRPCTDGEPRTASDLAGEDIRGTIAAAVAGGQRSAICSETAGPIMATCRLAGLAGLSKENETSEHEVTHCDAEIRVNKSSKLSPDRSIGECENECKPRRGKEIRVRPRTPYRVTRQYKNHKRTKSRAAKVRKYA